MHEANNGRRKGTNRWDATYKSEFEEVTGRKSFVRKVSLQTCASRRTKCRKET
jgi:hypothetical protein